MTNNQVWLKINARLTLFTSSWLVIILKSSTIRTVLSSHHLIAHIQEWIY